VARIAFSETVPVTVSEPKVPTEVSEEVTTVEFKVVPVKVPAAAVTVQEDPSVQVVVLTVVPVFTRSAFVTSPVAVNEPVTVSPARVPVEVKEEVTMPGASVVPVNPVPGTAAAVIVVLHPKPVLVVQIRALEAVEQVPTASAVGEAVPEVALPSTVFVSIVARSAFVTSPVAVNEPVTVSPAIVCPPAVVTHVGHESVPRVSTRGEVATFTRTPAVAGKVTVTLPAVADGAMVTA
jgi:hypothetical protein